MERDTRAYDHMRRKNASELVTDLIARDFEYCSQSFNRFSAGYRGLQNSADAQFLDVQRLENIYGRFLAWGEETGAEHSLSYKLRKSMEKREKVKSLLRELQLALRDGEYFRGVPACREGYVLTRGMLFSS
jgi:hypothetical protein